MIQKPRTVAPPQIYIETFYTGCFRKLVMLVHEITIFDIANFVIRFLFAPRW